MSSSALSSDESRQGFIASWNRRLSTFQDDNPEGHPSFTNDLSDKPENKAKKALFPHTALCFYVIGHDLIRVEGARKIGIPNSVLRFMMKHLERETIGERTCLNR